MQHGSVQDKAALVAEKVDGLHRHLNTDFVGVLMQLTCL